jgi:hypothetical protein
MRPSIRSTARSSALIAACRSLTLLAACSSLTLLAACGSSDAAPKRAKSAEGTKEAEPAPATAAENSAGWAHYGAPFAATQTVSAATLLADPAKYAGQTVQVTGRVVDVCSKAGCWMVVAEGDRSMRVLMKDHGFSVDKQGAGSDCKVEGVVEAKEIDPATVQHFAEESAKPEAMPEKGASGVIYQLVASGVEMKRPSPPAGG